MRKRIKLSIMGVCAVMAFCWVSPIVAEVKLEVLNPRGEIEPPVTLVPAPRVADLAGKRIGIYWNGKQGGPNFWDAVGEMLKKRFPTSTILRRSGPSDLGDTMAAKLAKEVDVFIYGVGD